MSTDQSSETALHLPKGFSFSGIGCGIKESGKKDLSLIVADRPCTASGVYTRNQIVAAPVVLCRQRTPSSSIRAVVTNSGNANACTGTQGCLDAEEMCERVAKSLGCTADDVLVMSTGIIGQALPMEQIRDGISRAHQSLAIDGQAFLDSADAICTTDKTRKIASSEIQLAGNTYRVAAMAKGAGMIAPNMATMLSVILTDAPLSTAASQQVLSEAVNLSFNRVSVDGHTSTNDTVLLLSSGDGASLDGESLRALQDQVNSVAIKLGKMLVADGEGASHFMAISIRGAQSDQEAERIANAVGASPLVKTAITGGDPNWGRIVSAAGYSDATIEPARVSLTICQTMIYENGSPLPFDEGELSRLMKNQQEVPIELVVGNGPGEALLWASDLTTQYVQFNSEYTT